MVTRNSTAKPGGSSSIPAAGYIRMSSSKQESSPAQQRREITELANRKGYNVVAWYEDDAISGDEIEKRPNFCRMLDDAKAGKFGVILCWDQDRFGRFDSLKAGYVVEPLRMRGVRLVTVTQGDIDWNDFAGRMIYAIQQEGKNQFLVSLSTNVLRGKMQAAREGHGVHRAPFGYDRVFYDAAGNIVHRIVGPDNFAKPKGWKSKLDVSERTEEVETVRFAFDRYATSDISMRGLAYELNQRGVRTRGGNLWCDCSVKALLKNPVYIGRLVFGKVPLGRFNRVGDGHVGGDEPIVVDNAHPAIIDRKTFDRVQAKLKRRAKYANRGRSSDYLLAGLLVCGVTNARMWGRRATVGKCNRYYTVKRDNGNGHAEDCFSIRKDAIEQFVLGTIAELLNQPDLRDRLRVAVAKRLKAKKAVRADATPIKKRLADLDMKIERATERLLLVDTDSLADATRLLATWRNERRRLAEELERTNGRATGDPEAEVNAVMAELATLRETISEADPAKVKAALRTSIESITLYWGPGGPRKWHLKRGVIRLGETLLFVRMTTKSRTRTRSTRMGG